MIPKTKVIANATTEVFSGIVGLFFFACVLTIIIYWIIFPILVLRRMKELQDGQREIAKALQWMVNNWRDDSKRSRRSLIKPTHVYEGRPRKDHRGVDLISDALQSLSAPPHRIALEWEWF